MKFIELTLGSGEKVWINLSIICILRTDASQQTRLYQTYQPSEKGYRDYIAVKETPIQIIAILAKK